MAIFGWIVLVLIAIFATIVSVTMVFASGFFSKGEPIVAVVVTAFVWWFVYSVAPFTMVLN